jgi:hypothetical protein
MTRSHVRRPGRTTESPEFEDWLKKQEREGMNAKEAIQAVADHNRSREIHSAQLTIIEAVFGKEETDTSFSKARRASQERTRREHGVKGDFEEVDVQPTTQRYEVVFIKTKPQERVRDLATGRFAKVTHIHEATKK